MRILIAEQYPLFRAGLLGLLEGTPGLTPVGTFENLSDLPNLVLEQQPDLVIFDHSFYPTGLREYCRGIRAHCPTLHLLFFSDEVDFALIRSYFRQGINGYLLKTAESDEIIQAIRCVGAGKTYLQHSLQINFPNWIFAPARKIVPAKITDREKEILKLVVEEYTTKEISQKLYISLCTVETHRMHLIQKLGVKNTAGLVRVALEDNLYTRV